MSVSATRTQPGLPRSVRVLTAALAAAAVIALVVGVWAAVEGPPPVWWRFVACAALFVLAGLASFSMRFGSHRVLFPLGIHHGSKSPWIVQTQRPPVSDHVEVVMGAWRRQSVVKAKAP